MQEHILVLPALRRQNKEEQKGYPSLHSQMEDSLERLGNPSWRNRKVRKKKKKRKGRRENKEKRTLNFYYLSGYFLWKSPGFMNFILVWGMVTENELLMDSKLEIFQRWYLMEQDFRVWLMGSVGWHYTFLSRQRVYVECESSNFIQTLPATSGFQAHPKSRKH